MVEHGNQRGAGFKKAEHTALLCIFTGEMMRLQLVLACDYSPIKRCRFLSQFHVVLWLYVTIMDNPV
jgi:hypothetical protein